MSLQNSYFPNYFSIDDIMATQEKVPCKFISDVPKLGCLNPSSETNDLKTGTLMELPYWLAESIALGRGVLAQGQLPRIYRDTYREILKADASAVDLHKLGIYYYDFGVYASKFDSNPNDVIAVLVEAFKFRFRELMTLTQNSGIDPVTVNRFDMLEKRIFQAAHRSSLLLNEWFITSGTVIEAADMVVNHKKRKLAEIDSI